MNNQLTVEEKNRLEEILIAATRNLDPTEAIDADDPRYIDCSSIRGEEGTLISNIGDAILRACKADSKPKTYLFSGHNGSGKSSELKSLEKELKQKKLFTIKIDAENTVDIEDPNYIDILFSITSEIEKQMRENNTPLPEKLMNFINKWFDEVIIEKTSDKSIAASLESSAQMGLKIPLIGELFTRLMGQLKYSSNERKIIRQKLEPKISDLMGHIIKMVSEADKILKKNNYLGLVIIYDNLEKMKLSYPDNQEKEGRSTHEVIYLDNAHHLTRIPCHQIYTVPLALLYSGNNIRLKQLYDDLFVLPMIKVCYTRSRKINQEGIQIFHKVASKRIDVKSIFEKEELIQEIALFSGGNVREFIRLLNNLVEVAHPENLPLTLEDVQKTFRRTIREYEIAPSDREFELLARIYKNFEISRDHEHYRMLYNHFVLAYTNGERWYDIHPAFRNVRKFKAALEKLDSLEKSESLQS